MKHLANSCRARSRIGLAALAFSGVLFLSLDPASAQGCGGGPLSTSTGNLAGSAVGAVAGGVLGNQFGHGSGKGVMTGVGVVGGALAGGYVGRSMEGCDRPSQPPPAPAAYSPPPGAPAAYGAPPAGAPVAAAGPQTCRYVLTQAQIDGRPQQINAIACLAPDGTWQTRSDAGAQRAAEADLVFRAQQQLRQQGFYVRDNIDGQWGPATSTAVRNFQRANGLQITAQLDVPTQTALGLNAAPLGAPVAAGGPPGPPEPYPASPTPSAGIVPAGAAR